jgi:hypothetical protein
MTALIFQRSTASSLYFAINSDNSLNKTVAYLLPEDIQQDPQTLTLAQALPQLSWQPYAGCFIYLNTTDYDESAFVIAARVFLWEGGFSNVRFAWFTNPTQSGDNSPLNGSLIIAKALDSQTYELREASLTISTNFTLFLAGGCQLTLDPHNENQLKISQLNNDNNSIAITSVFGTQQVPSISGAYIPGFGAQAGCIQFQIEITDTTLDENHLDVGLRYFVDDPNSDGNIISQRYPIFNPSESQTPINAWASLFLLDAFDPTRTFFSFNGQDGTGQEGTAVPTYFRTNAGNKVALTPQADGLAGFVFAYNPSTTVESTGDPIYNVPTGVFSIGLDETPTPKAGVSGVPAFRMMCGLSGVEYVGLMNAANNSMQFIAGQNAYAPTYMPPPPDNSASKINLKATRLSDSPSQLLAKGATTSWLFITPTQQTASDSEASGSAALQSAADLASTGVQYFAQPDDSVFYEAALQPNILNYMEVPAGRFPAPTQTSGKALAAGDDPVCYPMVPYAGVQADDFTGFQALELQVLSPARRNTIYSFLQPLATAPGDDRTGTTPQGRLATFSSDFATWQSLTLSQATYYELTAQSFASLKGKIPDSVIATLQALLNIAYPDIGAYEAALQAKLSAKDYNDNLQYLLQYGVQVRQWQFTNVQSSLKEALQTNQMFLVITSPEQLLNFCSFNYYKLTAQALDTLKKTIPNIVAKLEQKKLQDVFYASAQDYTNGLLTALTPAEYTANQPALFRYATFGEIVIQGWTFNISPNTWDSWDDGNTILVFKFYGKSVLDLANDTSTWTSGSAFNGSVQKAQADLVAVIQDGINRSAGEPEFADFASLVQSPNWNGILILRAYIPLAEMPPQLQGIAAGINPSLFYAHHIGVNITPVQRTGNNLSLQDSSLFGLIYYDDSQDLTYNNKSDYQFKVLTLKVLFKNSAIVSFASQIELYINRLFGELAIQEDSEHGNNIILNGVYQKQGDTESYVFSEQGDNVYKMSSKVLYDVEVLKAQFNSVIPPGGVGVGEFAKADFILWGNLHFIEQDLFDVFSFGKGEAVGGQTTDGRLSFSNLLIHMSFMPDPPAGEDAPDPTFTFDAGQIAFDLAKSAARPNSLYNHFPLKLKGFIQAKEKTSPTDLGYLPIDSPLNLSSLAYPWYGLQFELNLGGPGGLAAKIDFTATLVAAWAPGKNLSVFLGIKLPGSSGASKELTIESVLKLSIGGIEFQVSGDSTYMLKFDNIALKFFLVKFPPSGQTAIYLFGDPNNQDNTTLGWYAAYAKDKKKPQSPKQPNELGPASK